METGTTELDMSKNHITIAEEISIKNNVNIECSDTNKKYDSVVENENDVYKTNEQDESMLLQSTQLETKNGKQSITPSNCVICSDNAVKKRNVLCHKCNGLIHFHCTKCPLYMLFTLSTSAKKYVCFFANNVIK